MADYKISINLMDNGLTGHVNVALHSLTGVESYGLQISKIGHNWILGGAGNDDLSTSGSDKVYLSGNDGDDSQIAPPSLWGRLGGGTNIERRKTPFDLISTTLSIANDNQHLNQLVV